MYELAICSLEKDFELSTLSHLDGVFCWWWWNRRLHNVTVYQTERQLVYNHGNPQKTKRRKDLHNRAVAGDDPPDSLFPQKLTSSPWRVSSSSTWWTGPAGVWQPSVCGSVPVTANFWYFWTFHEGIALVADVKLATWPRLGCVGSLCLKLTLKRHPSSTSKPLWTWCHIFCLLDSTKERELLKLSRDQSDRLASSAHILWEPSVFQRREHVTFANSWMGPWVMPRDEAVRYMHSVGDAKNLIKSAVQH